MSRALGCQVYARSKGAASYREAVPNAVVDQIMKHAGAAGGSDALSNELLTSDVAPWRGGSKSLTFAAAR